MPTTANRLGVWQQTRNVLVENLALNSSQQAMTPFSPDSDSAFQKLQKNIDDLIAQLRDHALNGLKLVDEAIATSEVLNNLRTQSQAAKDETDRIKRAIKAVDRMTENVNRVTKVVESVRSITRY